MIVVRLMSSETTTRISSGSMRVSRLSERLTARGYIRVTMRNATERIKGGVSTWT